MWLNPPALDQQEDMGRSRRGEASAGIPMGQQDLLTFLEEESGQWLPSQ